MTFTIKDVILNEVKYLTKENKKRNEKNICSSYFINAIIFAQNITQKLDEATKNLMNSSGAISSNLSFYVSDEEWKLIYEYQGNKAFYSFYAENIYGRSSFGNFRKELHL
jgi:hypothetical protein